MAFTYYSQFPEEFLSLRVGTGVRNTGFSEKICVVALRSQVKIVHSYARAMIEINTNNCQKDPSAIWYTIRTFKGCNIENCRVQTLGQNYHEM